jgi:hypothetical protein
MSLLRLSASSGVITDDAPEGLKRLLTKGMRLKNFEALKALTLTHEAAVRSAYTQMAEGIW